MVASMETERDQQVLRTESRRLIAPEWDHRYAIPHARHVQCAGLERLDRTPMEVEVHSSDSSKRVLKSEPERCCLLRGAQAVLIAEANLHKRIANFLKSRRLHKDVEIVKDAERAVSVIDLSEQRGLVRDVFNLLCAKMGGNSLEPGSKNQVAPANRLAVLAQS